MISGQKQLRRLTHYKSGCSPQQPSGNRASQLSKGMRFRNPKSLVNSACSKAIGSLPYTRISALSSQGALARSRKSLAFEAAQYCQRHGHLK